MPNDDSTPEQTLSHVASIHILRPRDEPAAGTAPPTDAERGDDAEIRRLAALPPMQYDRQRKGAAAGLGVRASILDRLVRAERGCKADIEGGRALRLEDPYPWDEPVNGDVLLTEITFC